eukprot:Hpha_TRINITY_DN16953_c4_g3::TRINITY_DN16953_c4_g3_i1::g.52613::m.52613
MPRAVASPSFQMHTPGSLRKDSPIFSPRNHGDSDDSLDEGEWDENIDADVLLEEWEDRLTTGCRFPGTVSLPMLFCLMLISACALILLACAFASLQALENIAMGTQSESATAVVLNLKGKLGPYEHGVELMAIQAMRASRNVPGGEKDCLVSEWEGAYLQHAAMDAMLASPGYSWIFFGVEGEGAFRGYRRRESLMCTETARVGANMYAREALIPSGECTGPGQVVSRNYNVTARPWFVAGLQAVNQSAIWAPVYPYSSGGVIGSSVVVPSSHPGRKCVFALDLTLGFLHRDLRSLLPWPPSEGSATILSGDSVVASTADTNDSYTWPLPLYWEHPQKGLAGAMERVKEGPEEEGVGIAGEYIVNWRSLGLNGINWVVVITVRKDYVNREFRSAFSGTVAASIFVTILFAVVGGVSSHLVLAPVRKVAKGMLKIAGEFDVDLATSEGILAKPSSVAEVRTIQYAFLKMLQQLRQLRSYMPEMLFQGNTGTLSNPSQSFLRPPTETSDTAGRSSGLKHKTKEGEKEKVHKYLIHVYTHIDTSKKAAAASRPASPLAGDMPSRANSVVMPDGEGEEDFPERNSTDATELPLKRNRKGVSFRQLSSAEKPMLVGYDQLPNTLQRTRFEFTFDETSDVSALEQLKVEIRRHAQIMVGEPLKLYGIAKDVLLQHAQQQRERPAAEAALQDEDEMLEDLRRSEDLILDDLVLGALLLPGQSAVGGNQSALNIRCEIVREVASLPLVMTIVEWADLVTDLMFTFQIWGSDPELGMLSFVLLVVCLVVNVVLSFMLLKRAQRKSSLFSEWVEVSRSQTAACVVLAAANPVALELLWSQVPIPHSRLWAPVPKDVKLRIARTGLWTVIVHNIPQVMLQVYILLKSKEFTLVGIMTMVTSIFGLLCTTVKRLVSFILVNHNQEQQSMHMRQIGQSAMNAGLERRSITVLLTRLEGVENLMPLAFSPDEEGGSELKEKLEFILSGYYSTVFRCVNNWGGMVNQFNQTTVLSVFGWGHAEDHAASACACAVEIEARIKEEKLEIFGGGDDAEETQTEGGFERHGSGMPIPTEFKVLKVACSVMTNDLFVGSLGTAAHKAFHLFGLDYALLEMMVDLQTTVLHTPVLVTDKTMQVARPTLAEWEYGYRPVDTLRVPAGRSVVQLEEQQLVLWEILENEKEDDSVTPAYQRLHDGEYDSVCQFIPASTTCLVEQRIRAVAKALGNMPRLLRPRPPLLRTVRQMFDKLPGEDEQYKRGKQKWASVTASLLDRIGTKRDDTDATIVPSGLSTATRGPGLGRHLRQMARGLSMELDSWKTISRGRMGAEALSAATKNIPAQLAGSPRRKRRRGSDGPAPPFLSLLPYGMQVLLRASHAEAGDLDSPITPRAGSRRGSDRSLLLAGPRGSDRSLLLAGPRGSERSLLQPCVGTHPAQPVDLLAAWCGAGPTVTSVDTVPAKMIPSLPTTPKAVAKPCTPASTPVTVPHQPPQRRYAREAPALAPPPSLRSSFSPPKSAAPAPSAGPAPASDPHPPGVGRAVRYVGGGRFPAGWVEHWPDGRSLEPGRSGWIEGHDDKCILCCFPAEGEGAEPLRVRLRLGDIEVQEEVGQPDPPPSDLLTTLRFATASRRAPAGVARDESSHASPQRCPQLGAASRPPPLVPPPRPPAPAADPAAVTFEFSSETEPQPPLPHCP